MIRFDFEDQRVIVTGGTRGIGAAVSRGFVDAGAHVTALFAGNTEAAEAFRSEVGSDRLSVAQLDVGRVDAVQAFFGEWQGPLHVLVNNAGIRRDAIVGAMPEDAWTQVLQTNLAGAFHMAREAVRLMSRARYGRIIQISSPSARLGLPGQANYAASKAGLEAMTRSMCKEVAKRKITVNCVAPGFVDTELLQDLEEEQKAAYRKSVPLGRFAELSEVADAVLFLASDSAAYITGTVLDVTGGL